jgi:hypothetical protein
MQIEVTAQNIEDYGLDTLSGNDKETLLKRAAEAAAVGQVLYFKIPDEKASIKRMNIFDQFPGEPVVDLEHAEKDRRNPIEGASAEAAVQAEEFHKCEMPPIRWAGDEFTCRWCRKGYYADEETSSWVLVGELE